MLPRLLSSQYAMTNPGTITFCLPQRVALILVLNRVADFLLVTLSRLAGNLRLMFTILSDFSPLIIFVLFLYLARCTLMIATQRKFSYPLRLRPSPLYPRNPFLGIFRRFHNLSYSLVWDTSLALKNPSLPLSGLSFTLDFGRLSSSDLFFNFGYRGKEAEVSSPHPPCSWL